jgi:hypothetical protein
VPNKSKAIEALERIFGMVFSVITLVVFIGFPQILSFWIAESNSWLPILNLAVLRSLWLPIVVLCLLGFVKEVIKLIEGLYTLRLAIVITILNIFQAIEAAFIFLNNSLLNPDLLPTIANWVSGDGIFSIINRFNVILLAVIVFGLVVESVTAFTMALRRSE